jgi:uncharacterized membrane protein YjjP (DUF1212 family)
MPNESRGHEWLVETAKLALEFGRLTMEVGASAHYVEEVTRQVALGLGAERMDLRVGYASLTITLGSSSEEVTRIGKVGPLGVNQSLYHALRVLALRIERESFTPEEVRTELDRLLQASKRHADWVGALAVGIACAAFARLLDADWRAVGPVFIAATLAQLARRLLALRHVNVFLAAVVVAFVGAIVSGLGARWAGSQTIALDMVVPAVLLVPGVPSFNAQLDILEGRPTLGSARAVWVAVMLIAMAVGVWLALGLLGEVG